MDKTITITMTMPVSAHKTLRLLAVFDNEKSVSGEVVRLITERAKIYPEAEKALKHK